MSRKKKGSADPLANSPTTPVPPPDTDPPPPDGEEPTPTEWATPVAASVGEWDAEVTLDLTGGDAETPVDEEMPMDAELPAGADTPVDSDVPGGRTDPPEGVEAARELSQVHLRGLLEALVFASDKPMKATELARMASAPVKQVRELLAELKDTYAARGVVLDEVAGGWLFRTSAAYAPFVRELAGERPVRLTRAQLETLAIAAYRQPITRPEIDDIRGVDSGATLKLLLERDLVRILGKKDEPGRPILYGTTGAFLELFGLKSLRDLPTLKEFTELSEDSQRVVEEETPEAAPPPGPDTVTPPAPATQDELEDP